MLGYHGRVNRLRRATFFALILKCGGRIASRLHLGPNGTQGRRRKTCTSLRPRAAGDETLTWPAPESLSGIPGTRARLFNKSGRLPILPCIGNGTER